MASLCGRSGGLASTPVPRISLTLNRRSIPEALCSMHVLPVAFASDRSPTPPHFPLLFFFFSPPPSALSSLTLPLSLPFDVVPPNPRSTPSPPSPAHNVRPPESIRTRQPLLKARGLAQPPDRPQTTNRPSPACCTSHNGRPSAPQGHRGLHQAARRAAARRPAVRPARPRLRAAQPQRRLPPLALPRPAPRHHLRPGDPVRPRPVRGCFPPLRQQALPRLPQVESRHPKMG